MEPAAMLFIEKKLEEHGKTLKEIQQVLAANAVQNNKISILEDNVAAIWKKHDEFFNMDGIIFKISTEQAKLKGLRQQVAALWALTIPMGITLISLSYVLLNNTK